MQVGINAVGFMMHQNPPRILTSRLGPAGIEDGSRENRDAGADKSGPPWKSRLKTVRS